MLLEPALVTFLGQSPEVTALAGSGSAVRVYPLMLPQTPTFPALTYQRISGVRDRHQRGPSGTSFARIQCDAWAPATQADGSGYMRAKNLADAVRKAVDGYAGAMSSVFVQQVQVEGDRDIYESDAKLYRVSFDLLIWWTEGVA